MSDQSQGPIDVEKLLLTKRLGDLPPEALARLEKIEKLDVSKFSEEDVRAYIINPITEILGYSAGQIFSADHGHVLDLLDKKRFPDYKMKLWNENFWIIEAKKPRPTEAAFGYEDLRQALEYAIHPEVNAALVVLCDGVKFEVFDREESITQPIYTLRREELRKGFNGLRAFIDPMQVWFFQKRRIIRMLDKVFDREFNMSRVKEFKDIVISTLDKKRQLVLENFRAAKTHDPDKEREKAETASLDDIADGYMFYENPIPIINATSRRLVALSQPNQFHVMHRLFPDTPRDANDIYMVQGLKYLLELDRQNIPVSWMPSWLGKMGELDTNRATAIKGLLDHCLHYFVAYEPYCVILIAGRAIRRVLKVFYITNEPLRKAGRDQFAVARHTLPEISWDQIVASPEGEYLKMIDNQASRYVWQFVRQHFPREGFKIESAKHSIRQLWSLELAVLSSVPNYPALMKERSFGEMTMTEWSSVTYDSLAHNALCIMHGYDTWKEYLLSERRDELEILARMGSWAARKMLGHGDGTQYTELPDDFYAGRFFFGDVETFRRIRDAYSRK